MKGNAVMTKQNITKRRRGKRERDRTGKKQKWANMEYNI